MMPLHVYGLVGGVILAIARDSAIRWSCAV